MILRDEKRIDWIILSTLYYVMDATDTTRPCKNVFYIKVRPFSFFFFIIAYISYSSRAAMAAIYSISHRAGPILFLFMHSLHMPNISTEWLHIRNPRDFAIN